MNYSRSIFWDVEVDRLDPKQHATFIITRVLMRGTLADWSQIKKQYGHDEIKLAALQTRYLDDLTLSFCSIYFNEPKENFRCYTLKQLNPVP